MSNQSTGEGLCKAILITMEALTRQNSPEIKLDLFGNFEALNAPVNKTAIEEIDREATSDKSGHIRSIEAFYRRRATSDIVNESPNCSFDPDEGRKQITIDIDQYREVQFSMDETDIAQFCADASEALNWIKMPGVDQRDIPVTTLMLEVYRVVKTYMNALFASVEEDCATFTASAFGYNLGNSPADPTAITVPFLTNADGSPLYKGIQDMMHQYKSLNAQVGRPLAVGLGILDKFVNTIALGGEAASGIDFSKLNLPFDYFPSNYAPDIYGGTNNFALLAPGSAMVFTRNRNAGNFGGRKADGSFYGWFPAPLQRDNKLVNLDLAVNGDYCGNVTRKIQLTISLDYGFFSIPIDAYQASDRLSGVTGVFEYVASAV